MNQPQQEKQLLMKQLLEDLRRDESVGNIYVTRKGKKTNVGLINHFKLHDVIPNKWFDWVRKANAPIVIIGQDWGPYLALLSYIKSHEIEKTSMFFEYDEFLFKTFSSRTDKFIVKAIENTYKLKYKIPFKRKFWDLFFFTMAVLYTRQGRHFRGNENFDPDRSSNLSYKYVSKQLDIVKPRIVMPLGNLALRTVVEHYQLDIDDIKISDFVNKLKPKGYIKKGQTFIVPNFHPAAHIDPKIQVRIWSKIWDLINIEDYIN